MLTTLEAIGTRRSVTRLMHPGPNGAELWQMLRAAANAPDHGRCRPWRFIVVPRQSADDFGQMLADAYVRRCEQAGVPVDPAKCEKERNRPRRAPTLVVVVCEPRDDPRFPPHEQLAAVAAATQNLLLSATAMGYGSKWVTGAAATDPFVKDALGLAEGASVVGFVHLGTIPGDQPGPGRNVDISGVVRTWHAAAALV